MGLFRIYSSVNYIRIWISVPHKGFKLSLGQCVNGVQGATTEQCSAVHKVILTLPQAHTWASDPSYTQQNCINFTDSLDPVICTSSIESGL